MGIYNDVFVEIREPYHITDIFPSVNDNASEFWIECNSCDSHLKDVSFLVWVHGQNFEKTVFEDLEICPTTNISAGVGDTLTEASLRDAGKLGSGTQLKLGQGYNRFVISIEITNKKDLGFRNTVSI